MTMIGTRMVRPIRTIRTGTRRTPSCPATAFVSLLPWNYYTTTAAATSIQATPAASSQLFIVSHSVRPMSSLVAVFPFSSSSSSAQHASCHPTVFKSVFSTTSGENSNNNNNDDDNVRKKEKDAIVLPPPLHYKPWADRRKSDTNGIEVETVRGFIRVKRKNRLSPTRDLNFTAGRFCLSVAIIGAMYLSPSIDSFVPNPKKQKLTFSESIPFFVVLISNSCECACVPNHRYVAHT